jgi:ligand-binding sensor domain-containing protein
MHKIICFLTLLLVLHKAQAQEFFLKHYGIDDGLPSTEIYQVLQDKAGRLLAATDRGAVRFDGYTFENLQLNKQQSSYPVYYIYKSPRGDIFFSGLKGTLYQYTAHGLSNYAHNDKIAAQYKHAGILIANTLSQVNDSLWISYNNDYNYNYNIGSEVVTPNGRVVRLVRNDGIYFDFQHHFFYRQVSRADRTTDIQPLYITWQDGTVTTDTVNLNWASGYVRRLYVEEVAGLRIFCIGKIILIYKGKKKIGSHLFGHNIMSSTVMNGRDLYLGFENGGAAVYQFNKGVLSKPLHHYLESLTVNSVLQDHQKGIWFATQENGLYYTFPSMPKYWESATKIVDIQKHNHRVYAAQRSGLIQVFSKGKLIEQLNVPLKQDVVHHISFYKDSLLVLTNAGSYLRSRSKWIKHPAPDIHLLTGGNNVVYGTAASNAEFYTFSELGGKLLSSTPLPKRVISMHYSIDNELWLGTWEGLFKYNNKILTNLTHLNPVFEDRITAINELPGKEIVVASLGNGLTVYKNNKTFRLNVGNGLVTPVINSMAIDGDFIWLGTNKGLTRVVFKDDQFAVKHYGLGAGLPTLDIHEFSVDNGQLYLKWLNRMFTVSLDDVTNIERPGRVVMRIVYVNDQVVHSHDSHSFPHNQNQFRFHFNSIHLAAARQQQFRYMLEGFDTKWHTTAERFANYTNLAPGNYRFKVQAFIGNIENDTELAVFNFTITPAYWQRAWFPPIVFLILLLISLLLFRRSIVSIKNKNKLLLDLAESRQKGLVQLINPHFIFNILNTVQAAILKKDKIVAASIISRFAKLMRLSMELSKQKLITLEQELEFLHKYFELEAVRSPGKFTYDIEVQCSIATGSILIPSMLIQPFLENAIKHGISHLTGKKGVIHIKLECGSSQVLCTIDDNGVGRMQSALINRNMQTQYESSGIEITLNRLKLLHKEKKTAFVYHIVDKQNTDGSSAGTTVVFSVPFQVK